MLNAVKGVEANNELDNDDALLKIGALAKAAALSVPTIRHWIEAGLIEIAELTPSNYQLFAPDMIKRCEEVKRLQAKRMTLAEIKKELEKPTV